MSAGNFIFVSGATPSASFWNQIPNDLAALAAGTAIDDDAILARHIDWASTGVDGGIWWEELARTTLSSAADSVSATIAARKYLRIWFSCIPSGSVDQRMTFNGDTSVSYASKLSQDIAAPTSETSRTSVFMGTTTTTQQIGVAEYVNVATREKVGITRITGQSTAGAGTAPIFITAANKWTNTSSQITSITITNGSTGDYASGTELVVLGHN